MKASFITDREVKLNVYFSVTVDTLLTVAGGFVKYHGLEANDSFFVYEDGCGNLVSSFVANKILWALGYVSGWYRKLTSMNLKYFFAGECGYNLCISSPTN